MIYMVLAMDKNNLIGSSNRLPWHYKKDLNYYNELTKNKNVLMGYNTYLSLKEEYKIKKLPYNKVYVASLENINLDDATTVSDVIDFIKKVDFDLYITGGKKIYELLLKYCDIVYLTYINKAHKGDIYLNNFDLDNFKLVDNKKEDILEFRTYRKKDLC